MTRVSTGAGLKASNPQATILAIDITHNCDGTASSSGSINTFSSAGSLNFFNDGHVVSEHLLNHVEPEGLWLGFTLSEHFSVVSKHALTLESIEFGPWQSIENSCIVASSFSNAAWLTYEEARQVMMAKVVEAAETSLSAKLVEAFM